MFSWLRLESEYFDKSDYPPKSWIGPIVTTMLNIYSFSKKKTANQSTDTAPLQPELRFLLCCLRLHPTPGTSRQMLDLLQQPLDWDLLLDLAGWHGAMPLLYQTLKQVAPAQVPARVLDQLQAQYHANHMRNMILTGELLRLLELLSIHGIEAVPYKGPALALTLYGNLALRQITDLDILVRSRDVLKAKDALVAAGYRQSPEFNPAQERLHLRLNNVLHFFQPDGDVMLELHWAVTPNYLATRLTLDSLWPRLTPISLNGTSVLHLPPEELLLILCIHGSKHCWESLKWLCDVMLLILTCPALNWQRVTTLATETGNKRKLLLGLKLVSDLLATNLPDPILLEIQSDPKVAKLAKQTIRHLSGPPGTQIHAFQRAYFRLRMMDRAGDKLRYSFCFLFSPDELDLTFINLPPGLTFLYRPLRLMRLVGVYGLSHPQT